MEKRIRIISFYTGLAGMLMQNSESDGALYVQDNV